MKFVPQRFHGDVLLFVAGKEAAKLPIESWKPFIDGEIKVHPVDCSHYAMMDTLPAAKIGNVLASELAQQERLRLGCGSTPPAPSADAAAGISASAAT